MSDIKSQYLQADIRLRRPLKAWENAKEERGAFNQAAVAARQLEKDLKSCRGKRTQEQVQEVRAAERMHKGAAEALTDAESWVRDASKEYAAAKAAFEQFKPRYERWEAMEKIRMEEQRRLDEERKRRAQARRQYEEAQNRRRAEGAKKDQQQHSKPENERKHRGPSTTPQASKNSQIVHSISAKDIADWFQATVTAFWTRRKCEHFRNRRLNRVRIPDAQSRARPSKLASATSARSSAAARR